MLTQNGGKVVDNFLRVLFTWNTENEVTDVKDSLNFTLARIIRHSGSAYRSVPPESLPQEIKS